jgi:hypothetical protein
MIIKNPEKILKQWIPATTGDIWFVTDVSVKMDVGIDYEFKLITEAPVKSSPNQQYYHMTRAIEETAVLRLHKTDYGKNGVYQLMCGSKVWQGYCTDIDTMDKFISVLADMLPKL